MRDAGDGGRETAGIFYLSSRRRLLSLALSLRPFLPRLKSCSRSRRCSIIVRREKPKRKIEKPRMEAVQGTSLESRRKRRQDRRSRTMVAQRQLQQQQQQASTVARRR